MWGQGDRQLGGTPCSGLEQAGGGKGWSDSGYILMRSQQDFLMDPVCPVRERRSKGDSRLRPKKLEGYQ